MLHDIVSGSSVSSGQYRKLNGQWFKVHQEQLTLWELIPEKVLCGVQLFLTAYTCEGINLAKIIQSITNKAEVGYEHTGWAYV